MTLDKNLIVVVALVLFATLLLISSLDYSSGIIGSGGGPSGSYSYEGNNETPMNYTLGRISMGDNATPAPEVNAIDPFLGLFGRDTENGSSADIQESGTTLLLISIAAIAIGMVVAFVIVRRRRRRNARTTTVQQSIAMPAQPGLPDSCEGFFQLRFPQIREPFPLAWGTDEPLEMVIICKDGATTDARLSIDGDEAGIIRMENGTAGKLLKLEKGRRQITVSPAGDITPGSESRVDMRIVDYREEVVRIFNEMCLRLRPASDESGYGMTPRELERSFGERIPEAQRKLLDAAVTTFERANYSLHNVRRADYEVMYVSERGVT